MGILLLIISVAILLFVILSISDYDFISPGSIVCIMTLLALSVLGIYARQYEVLISVEAIVLVLLAVIAVCFGSILIPCRIRHIAQLKDVSCYSKTVILFALCFVCISTVLYFFEVRNIAISMGYNDSSPLGMLYYYRVATTTGGAAVQSKIVGQTVVASVAISYLILIDFIKRITFLQFQNNKCALFLEFITLSIFVLQGILSGGRTQFLYLIESVIFVAIFFYEKKNRKKISKKIIKRIIFAAGATCILFFLLGHLTGKTSILNFSETLFVYVGSPIAAFDKLIHGTVSFDPSSYGQNVFWGFFDILNRMGFSIEMNKMEAPFVMIENVETNIYGAFGRYYADFGILGVIIFPLIIGFVYQTFYLKMQNSNKNLELWLAIYLLCSQSLFDYCIEERFFLSVMSLGTFLRIFYMVIFYFLFKAKAKNANTLI